MRYITIKTQPYILHLARYLFLSLLQMVFWAIFILPAQGFFNSLIYFYSPMKQPRRSTTEQPGSLDDLSLWGSFRRSFSRRRSSRHSSTSTVPLAAALQEKECQEMTEDESAEQQSKTNATTEGLPAVREES
jgi:hypothetical protein